MCGYCSRGNIYTERSKINLYARNSEKNTKEAYRESTSPPSAGTPLAQSIFAGIPSISRGPYPSFVTHPNYHDGQFHQYYPPENPIPIPQSPATSAITTSAGMNIDQTSTMTSTTTTTSTSGSNTFPTIAREAHRSHTVFAPIDLVESLTKTNHLLVADMKSELQSMNNQFSTQSTENLKTRMEALEQGFMELREVVMQRTINNHLKPNPELLEVWDPSMMVLQKSNWTNMRLILNKVAEDNYPDLFPSEWDHQKLFTEMHEMHYKVFSEVMTTMFHQCGILMDHNIFEMQNYEIFLKTLHHHLVMGTVNMTQVGHFLILMTYMSFCRSNHYTDYLSDSEEALIEPTLWTCLVIISFRSTFHMKEGHRTINPYFKVLPTKVRRLHVIITRYMEQECHCENHVQCDIFPSPLTTEMILPSYQHFIQYLHQKGYTKEGGSIPTESGALNRYAETITMIVLARVNGYYSPHFPMSMMEEEDKAFHNINFTYAEIDFFTNKLKQAYPKIDTESLTNAINFLERQKEVNCPCSIHTQKRGYDWIVFNRLPDKLPSNTTTTLCPDIEEEDEDESGAASEHYSSTDLTAGYNGIFNPRVQSSSNDFSLTSRDVAYIRKKKMIRPNRIKNR